VGNTGRGVLEGAFALLGALEKAGAAGLTALAADSGLPKSGAHRLLEQLCALGAVEREGGVYRMGALVFRLGGNWQPYPGLLTAAQQPVRRLAEGTGACVAITVLSAGRPMVVTGQAGEVAHLVPNRPGSLWPWSCAAGRVLLAYVPPARPAGPLPPSWREASREVRERGAAFSRREPWPGVCGAAVPLYGRQGEVIGALSALVFAGRDPGPLAAAVSRVARLIGDRLRRTGTTAGRGAGTGAGTTSDTGAGAGR